MDHSFYTDRLSALYDMELKHEEHQIVQDHVDGCAECQAILKRLEEFDSFASSNCELSENKYWEEQAEKIEKVLAPKKETVITEVASKPYTGLWWKLTAAAASVAVLAFITMYEGDILKDLELTTPPPNETQERIEQDALTDKDSINGNISAESLQTDDQSVNVTAQQVDNTVQAERSKVDNEEPSPVLAEQAGDDKADIARDEFTSALGQAERTNDEIVKEKSTVESAKPLTKVVPAPVKGMRDAQSSEIAVDGVVTEKRKAQTATASLNEGDKSERSSVVEETLTLDSPGLVSMYNSPTAKETVDADVEETVDQTIAVQEKENNNLDLAYWQKKRDSLESTGQIKTREDKASKKVKLALKSNEIITDEELLEVYYQIALLSNDKQEVADVVEKLRAVSQQKSHPHQKTAEKYLKTLQTQRK